MAPPAAAQAAAPDLCRGGFICFYTETSFGGLVESVNSVYSDVGYCRRLNTAYERVIGGGTELAYIKKTS